MENISKELENLILARYSSIRKFSIDTSIPYSTLSSIFRRGITNASMSNIIKICNALDISIDALTLGRIVKKNSPFDICTYKNRAEKDVIIVNTYTRESNKILTERIKTRRLQLGLTLADIAEYLGVAESTVQRYESGATTRIGYITMEKLSAVLKTTPAYLMGWEDTDNSLPDIRTDIHTIAAHHESEDWTEEELAEIEKFKEFVRSKRKQSDETDTK